VDKKLKLMLVSIVPPHNDCGVRIVMHRHLVERAPFELHVASNADFADGLLIHTKIELPFPFQKIKKSRFGPALRKWILDFENMVWPILGCRKLDKAVRDFQPDVILTLAETGLCHIAHDTARKHGIRTIIAGTNSATEGMRMPPTWSYRNKLDKRNLMDIVRKHGKDVTFNTFPLYSSFDQAFDLLVRKIDWVSILDLVNYEKKDAETKLVENFDFKPYPFKHYESVFTRFYQGFILPNKFGIDKRKSHLSTLIMTNQISRTQALDTLSTSPYPTQEMLKQDLEYFLKRMHWTESNLLDYLDRPSQAHSEFKSDDRVLRFLKFGYFSTRSVFHISKRILLSAKYRSKRILLSAKYRSKRILFFAYHRSKRILFKTFSSKKERRKF
jgi:hypothetical protein